MDIKELKRWLGKYYSEAIDLNTAVEQILQLTKGDDKWDHEAKCDCSNCNHLKEEVSKFEDRSANRSITYPYSVTYKLKEELGRNT